MNYLKEWEYPNLPSLKEISEQYEHESQVDFLNNQIKISAKENLFWAIRRKYYILAQNSEIIQDLDKSDKESYLLTLEIINSLRLTSDTPVKYSDSCLPVYLQDIQDEISKDAISVGYTSEDSRRIEEFVDATNLFMELRKRVYVLMATNAMLADTIVSISDTVEETESEERTSKLMEVMKTEMNSEYETWVVSVKNALIEGISNFAALLFNVLYRDSDVRLTEVVPRFSAALHIDEARENKALSILNNAVNLEINQEEKMNLFIEAFDLNPVDSGYYLNAIDLFPDLMDTVFSTSTFFAVPLRTDVILKNISETHDYSVEKAEKTALKVAEFFDLPQTQLDKFRQKYRDTAVYRISFKVRAFTQQNNNPSLNDVIQLLQQLESQFKNKQVSLQDTDILPDVKKIATQCLTTYVGNILQNGSSSYASCMKQIDEVKDQLRLQGEIVVSTDPAYSIVRNQFQNRIGKYTDSLPIGEKTLSECMEAVKQKFAEYEMPLDNLSDAMEVRLTERAVENTAKYISSNWGQTEEDARRCLETASQKCKAIGLSNEATTRAIAPANQRLADLDLQYRTVNGTVTASREEADTLRNLDNQNMPLRFKGDFLAKIRIIQAANISDSIKSQRIAGVQKQLQELEEKCSKAARYEYYLKTKSRFWNGDNKDMIIHYIILIVLVLFSIYRYSSSHEKDMLITGIVICVLYCCYMFLYKPTKEKKLWEEITSNGQYKIDDIMDEQKTTIHYQ